ncbi:MAG: hypothetical protein JKY53_10620 [Flavobacteriales bacterium]|nr:hypothetical protein [Flavobacteriales bacterium]
MMLGVIRNLLHTLVILFIQDISVAHAQFSDTIKKVNPNNIDIGIGITFSTDLSYSRKIKTMPSAMLSIPLRSKLRLNGGKHPTNPVPHSLLKALIL